jgi:sulfate permease, SulP family
MSDRAGWRSRMRRGDDRPVRWDGPGAPVAGLVLLRRYRLAWLRPDVLAGLTVGAMLVPQSMAYAELAGVPAATGLYASLLAPVAYALVGTSRHLGTGPEPGTAILAATGVAAVAGTSPEPARYLALMAALALLVGVVAGVAWVLRLGFVAHLLSKPVLIGYISGVGFVLLSSQLAALTGVPITAGTFFPRLVEFAGGIGLLRAVTVLLGLSCLLIILGLRRFAPRAPGALIAVGLATIASMLFDLPARGDPTIGAIPTGLPALTLPDIAMSDLRALLPVALGVALVGFSDNVLTGRAVATKAGYRIDANQELAGLASANLGAGLLQGMPVSSSASRSAVAASLGGVTSLVNILAAGVVAVTLLVAGDVLGAVPRVALAAVIVAAAFAIIDLAGFRELWRISRAEFALAVITSLGVMVFDVLVGVVVAVALSVVIALARMAHPEDSILGARDDLNGWVSVESDPRARTLPGLLVYRFDAPLFFMNVEHFRTRLLDTLQENPGEEIWVVLDFEGIGDIDATALDEVADVLELLDEQHVEVIAVARANTRTLERLARARLLVPHGRLQVFATINAAVDAFEHRGPSR